jgi:beta-galactosidase GanA
LNGRDIVAEMIERCHQRGIAVVLYVSVIHDRWASDQHPDWRIVHPNGGHFGRGSRHGFVCPNSPYREYVRAWTREIAERFDLDGMRFDMTFWTCVCYCAHCQERWRQEVGGDAAHGGLDGRALGHLPAQARAVAGRVRGDVHEHRQGGAAAG